MSCNSRAVSTILSSLIGLSILFAAAVFFFKWGWKKFIPVTVVAVAGLIGAAMRDAAFLSDYLTVVVSPMIVGGVWGYTFSRGKSLYFFVLVTSLSLSFMFTADYYFLKLYKNYDLVKESRARVADIVRSSEMPEKDKTEFLSRLDASMDTVKDVVPFTYFLNSVLGALLCFYIMKAFFSRYLGGSAAAVRGLEFFKLNDYFIYALIAGWLSVLLVERSSYYAVYVFGLNLALSFSVLYLIQSFGIIKYLLMKKNIPVLVLPAGLLVIALLGIEALLFVGIILLSVGALDFWADFRKLETRSK